MADTKANADTLVVRLGLEGGKKFALELDLNGRVDPSASSCELLATKAEIKLKKAEPKTWTALTAATVKY